MRSCQQYLSIVLKIMLAIRLMLLFYENTKIEKLTQEIYACMKRHVNRVHDMEREEDDEEREKNQKKQKMKAQKQRRCDYLTRNFRSKSE